jgi:hypothetical protein
MIHEAVTFEFSTRVHNQFSTINHTYCSTPWYVALQLCVIGKWATKRKNINGMLAVLGGKGRVIVNTYGFVFE